MDTLAPLKELNGPDATQRGTGGLPGWSPLPWLAIEKELPQEEVADGIRVWWQLALGTKAVLGQASNRPAPGQRAPLPELLWAKPDSGHAQQERNVVEVIPGVIDKKGTRGPGTQERKGPSSSRSLSTLGRLKQRSGVVVSSTVVFLVVMFLRSVVAVFETIRWALGILTVGFRRGRRWPHRFKDFLLLVKPLPAGGNS